MIGKSKAIRNFAVLSLHLLLGAFALPGAVVAQDAPKYAREYRQTFKGPQDNPKEFFFLGPDAEARVKFEAEGLRIKLPAGHPSGTDTGLMTRFGVQGDFEITLKYEVLQESAPNDAGAQTRFSLYVIQDTNKLYRASFNRHWTGGPPEFFTWIEVPGLTPGKSDTKVDTIPATAKTGKLRLTRRGTELSFFAAEGDDANFKLLRKYTFGADNLRNVRITAATDGPQAAVEVRVTDFLIRAAAFPRLDKIAAQAAKPLQKDAPTYHEPFQGKPQTREDFVLIGKDAAKRVKFEPEGLRITLPAGAPAWQPTGVATAFGVAGDFEASVRYEILAEPEPADAGSAGTQISLTANVGGININDASVRRKVLSFRPAHARLNTSAEKLTDYFPVKEKTGRLRMVRTGDLISYCLAEGFDEEFKLLTTHPFDAADVQEIQVSAQTSGPKAALDVRFTDLQVRAAALVRPLGPPKTAKGNESAPAPKREKAGDPEVPTKDYAQTYEQSFKGKNVKPAGWEFTAPAAEEWVQFEPAGLRLTMPAGHKGERRGAGIQTAFGAKGDFEITLTFEFLQEPAPSEEGKFATRLLMGVALDTPNFDTPTSEVATLNRSLLVKGERTFTTWMRNRENPKGLLGGRPTTGPTGRLRLVRSGDELFCLVSVGAEQPLALIKKYRFGAENVKRVAITGMTGHQNAMLDVRITDFRIRADAIPGLPSAAAPTSGATDAAGEQAPPAAGNKLIALQLVGFGLPILVAFALAAWLNRRRLGRAAPPASTEAARPSVSLLCPKCAKAFRAKAKTAGKKVRCPGCGTAVLVPLDSNRPEGA